MDKNFGDALNYFSQYDRQFVKEEAASSVKTSTTKNRIDHPNQNSLIKYISEYIKTRTCKEKTGKPRDFFSVKKKKLMAEIQLHLNQNPTQNENVIRTQQKKYIKVFLFMYLGYLNELVSKKLLECSGYIGSQKIGYLLSMEKRLMNDIVGTKKNLRELLLASSFIQKNNDSKKVQIITQGEEVLPLLLHRLSLDLPLKSYFVLSQLHATYLQLTLKQVVKIASDEEDVAAITIQDKIIRIENIYDILPKNVWKYMIANKEIMNNCPSHNKRFLSLENYREFKIRINSFVFKRVNNNNNNNNKK